jgi:uncharacterized membrane protein YfcA
MVAAGGFVAGLLGALLGLGGGVLLVPFIVVALGLPYPIARGISLLAVVATSSAVAAAAHGALVTNVRLAMALQVVTVVGGFTGGLTSRYVSERALTALFALVMLLIAAVMLARLNRRNVPQDRTGTAGPFDGRIFDPELNRDVTYRMRRLPVAALVSFVSGNISSLLGIGGGILLVPALNAWCGIPMRVAAATSAFMVGVTAMVALPLYWAHGEVLPHLAGAAVLGVLVGSRLGILLVTRTPVRWLKLLMIAVLLVVSLAMFTRLIR